VNTWTSNTSKTTTINNKPAVDHTRIQHIVHRKTQQHAQLRPTTSRNRGNMHNQQISHKTQAQRQVTQSLFLTFISAPAVIRALLSTQPKVITVDTANIHTTLHSAHTYDDNQYLKLCVHVYCAYAHMHLPRSIYVAFFCSNQKRCVLQTRVQTQ
jgi:hypothetical protein